MARHDNKKNLIEMSDFLKIYCVWDECSLLFFHVADLASYLSKIFGWLAQIDKKLADHLAS